MFADLFTDVGRRSVPPMIVAVVMVLQRIEGCSDREAVDRFAFDARWKYAAGGLDFDYPGFVHTVLVDMRARLAARMRRTGSSRRRWRRPGGRAGRAASGCWTPPPLYDAVATMDTVTLIRSAIRGLLKAADAADAGLAAQLRAVLARDDDYAAAGKPVCDYDDPAARVALVDALAKDGAGAAGSAARARTGRRTGPGGGAAGHRARPGPRRGAEDGVFRIARRVAKDRVISTVDPEARHGHKTAARGFDGYKGHVAIDPDSEIITATTVTAGNAGDAAAAADLLAEDLPTLKPDTDTPAQDDTAAADTAAADTVAADTVAADTTAREHPTKKEETAPEDTTNEDTTAGDTANDTAANEDTAEEHPTAEEETAVQPTTAGDEGTDDSDDPVVVYGDAAYGAGKLLQGLEAAGAQNMCKVQPPTAAGGRFTKDAFGIDLPGRAVTCPAGRKAPLKRSKPGMIASFGPVCASCPLAAQCTTAKGGRTVYVGPYEEQLAAARTRQRDPDWQAGYRATRPKVERKIGHLMRRRHGGRRARVRGPTKIAADFALLAAAVNLARLAVLGLHHTNGGWAAATA